MVETDTDLSSGIKLTCSREKLVETVTMVARAVSVENLRASASGNTNFG